MDGKKLFLVIFLLIGKVGAQAQAGLGNLVLKLLCFFFFIFPGLLTLLFVVGGFLILRGSKERRALGKKIIVNAIVAFFILIFLAWLVTLTSPQLDFGDYSSCFVGGEPPSFPVTTTLVGDYAPWADARGSGFAPPPAPEQKNISWSPGEPIYFSGSRSVDFDGTIVSYEWDFGDGSTGSGENVSHVYPNQGAYTVKLKVTDNDGLTDEDEIWVYLYPLEAHILQPVNYSCVVNGTEIEFLGEGKYGSPYPLPDDPYNYSWVSHKDGSLSDEKNFTLNSSNLTLGNHSIQFTVEDYVGDTASDNTSFRMVQPLVAEILNPADDGEDVNCSEKFRGRVLGGRPPYDVVWKANGTVFDSGTIAVEGGIHITDERPPVAGTYNISFLAEDSCELVDEDSKGNINVSLCTADVLIVALKQNIVSAYSSGQITQLENKIEDYMTALKNDSLSSIFLYLDEEETSDIIGSSEVTDTNSWSNIDAVLDQLIPKLESEYLVIIGGDGRFPQSPDVGSYTGSDDPYGDYDGDGNYLPDIPVGRFPDPNSGELEVILNALGTSINLHQAGGVSLSSYLAPIMGCGGYDNRNWNTGRCFCSAVWGGSCSACGDCCGCIEPSSTSGKDFVMILAHGPGPASCDLLLGGCFDSGTSSCMGHTSFGPPEVPGIDISDAVWMSMACGGGHLKLKSSTSGSIAMTFLKRGGAIYFGSTNNNYGGLGGGCPVKGGDSCIGSLYAEIATRFSTGKRIGDAYMEGKNYYLNHYSSCPPYGILYQAHINCLYGDPTLKIKDMW